MSDKQISLRRGCDGCIKAKRRCDRTIPRCGRCAGKRIQCFYVNTPLEGSAPTRSMRGRMACTISNSPPHISRIYPSLQIEVIKVHGPPTIQFLIERIGEFPISFAHTMKTSFVHPELYRSRIPDAIKDAHAVCKIHLQTGGQYATPSPGFKQALSRLSAQISRRANHPATFSELLACVQALILTQCILLFGTDEDAEFNPDVLMNLAKRLWEQAPIQLPHHLDPHHAWLFAESVRRTIIMAFIVCSAHSLKTRSYSIRTPFVDALPFDIRTALWDEASNTETWTSVNRASSVPMVSLHEYTDMLETGYLNETSSFGMLIWAACRGLSTSRSSSAPAVDLRQGVP